MLAKKINFYFFNFGLFCFLFLWDIKIESFQFRYLILIPLISLLLDKNFYNFKKLLFILFIPLIILFHYLIISYFNNYIYEKRDIFGFIFLFLIFIVTFKNLKNFKTSLSIVIDTFTFAFSILFIIFSFILAQKYLQIVMTVGFIELNLYSLKIHISH